MFTHSEIEAWIFLLFVLIAVFGFAIPYSKLVFVESAKRSKKLYDLKNDFLYRNPDRCFNCGKLTDNYLIIYNRKYDCDDAGPNCCEDCEKILRKKK